MPIAEYWKPPAFPEIGSSYDCVIIHRLGHHYCTWVCGTDLQNIGEPQKNMHFSEEKSWKTSQIYVDICVAITYSLHSNPKLLIVQNVALSLTFILFIFSTLVKVNEGIYTKNARLYSEQLKDLFKETSTSLLIWEACSGTVDWGPALQPRRSQVWFLKVSLQFFIDIAKFWSIAFYSAKTWTLQKVDQNTCKVLKYSTGEGWRRSDRPIMWEMKKCYKESRRTGISYKQYKEGRKES